MTKIGSPIPERVYNAAEGGFVTGADSINDDAKGKNQEQINKETDDTLEHHQNEINALDKQNYVSVVANAGTHSATEVLPATGQKVTIYRVGQWDGTTDTWDPNVYSEYSWDQSTSTYLFMDKKDVGFDDVPTEDSNNLVTSGGIYEECVEADEEVGDPEGDWEPGTAEAYVDEQIAIERQRAETAENTLRELYNSLNQSDPDVIEPTDTWPVANPDGHTIYRVIDRVNTPPEYYEDYMWNGTSMVLMGHYDNAIDDVPTPNSNNLVKSGGVFNDVMTNGSAFDLTAYNNGATYADLNAALTALNVLPSDYKKGGMSMKFIWSAYNKYVQYRLKSTSFSINVNDWIEVGVEPTDALVNWANDNFPAVNTSGQSQAVFGTGTGYVEINKDSVILTNAHGTGTCADIAFYDANKSFLGYLGGVSYNTTRFGLYEIPSSFQNAKYIRASFYTITSHKYLYVLDKNSIEIQKYLCNNSVIISRYYDYRIYQSSCVITDSTISAEIDNAYFLINSIPPVDASYFTPLLAIKLRCDSITGAESVRFSYNTVCYEEGVEIGQEIMMVVPYTVGTYFNISKKSSWSIIDIVCVYIKNEIVDSMFSTASLYNSAYSTIVGGTQEIQQWFWRNCFLMKEDVFELEKKELVKGVPRAEQADFALGIKNSNPFFYGKTYCCFGTSISSGSSSGGDDGTKPYCKYVGGYFGMKVKNIAKTSTVCYGANGNIRPEVLALMPEDTLLVSMLNGANGWITSDDIDSIDTNNAIGAYNVAIDYIREHYPTALIVIGCDQSFGPYNDAEKDMRRIAANKKVLLAETYHITNNRAQRADTLHPNIDSKLRLAAGVIAAAENGILRTIIECKNSDYEKISW